MRFLVADSVNACLLSLGNNDSMAARFSMQAQHENLNTFQFDAASMPLQNPLPNTSQQSQFPRSDSLLALAPSQSSTSSFQGACAPNVTSHYGTEDFFPKDEVRMRSNEMLKNEDMQHLLRIYLYICRKMYSCWWMDGQEQTQEVGTLDQLALD